MKLKILTLALTVMVGTAWAQNPDVIQNTQNTLQNVQKKQAMDQNGALAAAGQATAGNQPAAAKPVPSKPTAAPQSKSAGTTAVNSNAPAKTAKSAAATAKKQLKTVVAVNKPQAKQTVAVEDKKAPEESKKKEPREYSAAGRRDPFISPVVSHTVSGGSGCSSGKRCLAVDQIVLTGIVKSDTGMIAVVVNSMNKAYFLRENDPVFNGYVVKITGDSIIFNQTVEDKLGKPFTREVTKKIATPAV
jgi:Tfp pilus assembly protein PilP